MSLDGKTLIEETMIDSNLGNDEWLDLLGKSLKFHNTWIEWIKFPT